MDIKTRSSQWRNPTINVSFRWLEIAKLEPNGTQVRKAGLLVPDENVHASVAMPKQHLQTPHRLHLSFY